MRWLTLVALLFPTSANALFSKMPESGAPVARLIANVEKEPRSAYRDALLARLHSLAYAQGDKTLVRKPYGYGGVAPTHHVSHGVEPPTGWHLDEAIRLYRLAIAELPPDPTLELGLAWCLVERNIPTGDVEARVLLRTIGDGAWKKVKLPEDRDSPNHLLAVEAARYLLGLLDPIADKKERVELYERTRTASPPKLYMTPILVPLGDDVTLAGNVDPDARVTFDLDGRGAREWGWIRGDAAWLVWDPEGDGRVESGLELFGSVTFWMFWSDGYAALRALDDDRDGLVSGAEMQGLALWQDDGDGVSEPGEVVPVEDRGVVALRTDASLVAGVPQIEEGVRFADGRTRPTWDWILSPR